MQEVQYIDIGDRPYAEVWDYQEELLKQGSALKRAAGRGHDPFMVPTQHYLLFCEHPHVYTLGKSGDVDNLLISKEECEKRGVSFFKINRGGDITYHGPGQIVGYPIFDLEKFKPDLHWYLRGIEESIINLLKRYGLKGSRMDGFTGVWLHAESEFPRKICAIGVRCSRWISMHGFAFNVNTDLQYFDYIVPCGLEGKGATSLERELGHKVDYARVQEELKEELAKEFGYVYAKGVIKST